MSVKMGNLFTPGCKHGYPLRQPRKVWQTYIYVKILWLRYEVLSTKRDMEKMFHRFFFHKQVDMYAAHVSLLHSLLDGNTAVVSCDDNPIDQLHSCTFGFG